jgi:hypothetical protein
VHFIVLKFDMNLNPPLVNLGIAPEQRMLYLEQRSVQRQQRRLTSQRHRAASLNASDFNSLAKVDATVRQIQHLALAGYLKLEIAMELTMQLCFIRERLTEPMDIYVHVWTSNKNRSISTLEYGDDEISSLYGADRAQLQQLFLSLRTPALFRLSGSNAGYCDAEFAFVAWMFKTTKITSYVACQSEFHMEWSRISRCVSAFQSWFYANHSFRVTNALHFWAPHVINWNRIFLAWPTALPPGYEGTWCPGIDATVMPIAMPSDILLMRALADGTFDLEVVEAERRFWVIYKHAHGIKFQALQLCNGLIGDLSGIVLGTRHDSFLFDQSELDDRLHDMHINLLQRNPQLQPFTALADSAYPETLYVKRVLSGNSPDAVLLSALRCPVEWAFCKLFREFPSLKASHRNKIFSRQTMTEKFVCCAIFSNMLACVKGERLSINLCDFCVVSVSMIFVVTQFCRQSNGKLFWRSCPQAAGLYVFRMTNPLCRLCKL